MASLSGDIRILLAAPSPRVHKAVKRVLIEAGYRVTSRIDGQNALEAAEIDPPTLLITVPDLPSVRGAELAARCRQLRAPDPLPCIYLLPTTDERQVAEGPWDTVLRLPFAASDLLQTVVLMVEAAEDQAPPRLEVEVAPPAAAWSRQFEDAPTTDAAFIDLMDVPSVDFDLDAEELETDADEPEIVEVSSETIEMDHAGEALATGFLSEHPLGSLLIGAADSSFTGILVLTHGELEKRIHFRHGHPVYCESNLLMETLGEYLVQKGIISEQDLSRSLARMVAAGVAQGEALVSLKLISREQLADAIHAHVREKVVNAFAWKEAAFRFEAPTTTRSRVLSVEMQPLWLVTDAVRRFTSPQTFLRFVDENLARYLIPSGRFKKHTGALGNIPGGQLLLEAIDGQRSLEQVRAHCRLDDLILAQLLLSLMRGDLVQLADAPADRELSASLSRDEIIGEMESPFPEIDVVEPAAAGALDESVRSLQDEVLELYTALPQADAFEILGLETDATVQDVAQAYEARLRAIGPDRFGQIPDPEIQRMAREVYLRMLQAYDSVRTPAGLEAARASAAMQELERESRSVGLDADMHYRKGRALLEEGEPAEAAASFVEAGRRNRREPMYALYAGWASYLAGKASGDTSLMGRGHAQVQRALEVLPIMEEGYVFLARIAIDQGDRKRARELVERALMFDPGHAEARSMLAELRAR